MERFAPATNSLAIRPPVDPGDHLVTPFYAGASAPRNLACTLHATSLLPASAGAPPVPPGSGPAAVHPGLVEHPDLTPEVQIALLAAVDEAVIAELGDLTYAIPDHPRPISAVLALVDAGLRVSRPTA